jgi:hypothetical protein
MKTQRRDVILGFHPYFDIRHNLGGTIDSFTRPRHFTPKKIPWYSFLLEAEWTPGVQNEDRRNRPLDIFQKPYRESNTKPSLL